MRWIFSIIFLTVLFLSCEKIELRQIDDNIPVIEGYICPGKPVELSISRQLVYASEETGDQQLNGLEVYLISENDSVILENTGNGIYCDSSILIVQERDYGLSFIYNGKKVTSGTLVPSKPKGLSITDTVIEAFSFDNFSPSSGSSPEMPDNVTISWSNASGAYHMIVVECLEESPHLINSNINRPSRSFRNAPTQGASQDINPMTFVYYGNHRIILYSLNSEYAALYEQLGTTSLDITAPPSNVNNGLGIFTGINADTLLVKVVEQ